MYSVSGGGILPNGTKYNNCIKPEDGFLLVLGKINPTQANNTWTQTTNCAITCKSQNQIYDANIQTCVSCRDPTASAPIVKIAPDSKNTVNNNTILGGQYLCFNKPIKTYDSNGNLLNQTCDSGETFNKDKMCETLFWAKNK
jgi:hypothetical protein